MARAFPNPPTGAGFVVFTVAYERGNEDKPEGTLLPGQSATEERDALLCHGHE